MKTGTLFKLATESIAKNKMRTLLTMLGIVIGIGSVIVMVAVGNGATSQIQSRIASLGTNMLVVTPGSTSQGGASQGAGAFNRLTVEDAERLKRDGTTLAAVSPVIVTRTQVIGGSGNWRTGVNGVSTDYLTIRLTIRDWQVTGGALFTDDDVRAKRRVVVLGSTVAKNLFPGGDPVGAQVQLGRSPFTVVGVLASKGQTASGSDQDDVVLVPYTTAQERLAAAEAQRKAAEQAATVSQQRYQLGAATLVELAQARASRVQAASAEVSARYEVVFQKALMSYYTGELDPAHVSLGA
jgi:putative ABC transport system permease protein